MSENKIFLLEDMEMKMELFKLVYNDDDVDSSYDIEEAKMLLSRNKYTCIFLDYELGTERTGMEICDNLSKYQTMDTVIYLHSVYPDKRLLMKTSLKKQGFTNIKEICFDEILRLRNDENSNSFSR
jgi:hypothetical protein